MMNRNGQDESANLNPLLVILLGGACWVATTIIRHWEALVVLGTVVVLIAWFKVKPEGGDE